VRDVLINTLRGFRHSRGTLLLTFAILTLATTAATVTFSIVDGVALRPLPYAAPGRLVAIATPGISAGTFGGLSPADYFKLGESAQAFAVVAASRSAPPLYRDGATGPEAIATRLVTTNLFEVLGVTAAAGRVFGRADARSTGPAPAILSYEAWARQFGSDASVIGRIVGFGPQQVQIVGVLPRGVWYPMELAPPAIYLPYLATEADRANTRIRPMSVVARLRSDISLTEARADVVRVVTTGVIVMRLQDRVVGPAKRWLYLVLTAVALVVLIASVNVATLLLARAAARAQEFAIRASLGESRRTLGLNLFLEGLAIATAAGIAAIVLAAWGLEAIKTAIPPGLMTRVSEIAINGRVVLASIAMIAGSATFGGAPALLASRSDLMSLIKSAGGPIVGGHRIDRTLARFLVAEVTVVCVLLVATTLVVQSFIRITTADMGFDRQNVATVDFWRAAAGTDDAERQVVSATLRAQLLERARAVRGVTAAAISINAPVPLAGASIRYSIVIPGFGQTQEQDLLETRIVTPDYFTVMGMQLVSGRLINELDRSGSPPVMLINEMAARRFFPDRDPVGQVVTFRGPTTIVGVLRSVRFDGPEGEVRPEMYIPADQERLRMPMDMGAVVVRTNGPTQQIAAAVREAIRPVLGVEPEQPRLVDEFFRRITAGRRFNALVMAGFGAIAVILGMAGVYATMQFLISRRFRDIGLRMALGATRGRIMRSVLTTALMQVALGMTIGLITAWAVSNAFRSFVFGITPTEPGVYAEVAAVIVFIGMTAAALPAFRASRLDPLETLRRE
jgi:predicted permease